MHRKDSHRNKKNGRSYRDELQSYFSKKNLGIPHYKIATLGTKGKERYTLDNNSDTIKRSHGFIQDPSRYMATVSVESIQFKTYPDTFASQVEAEEALANIVISKLGIPDDNENSGSKETKDLLTYGQRIVLLLGKLNDVN